MSDPTTPEGRAELRRLHCAAGDQPWAIWHDLKHEGFATIGDEAGVLSDEKPFTEECNPFAHVYTDELAELIVAAVNALPELLDTLDVLSEEEPRRMEALRSMMAAGTRLVRIERDDARQRAEMAEDALKRVRELCRDTGMYQAVARRGRFSSARVLAVEILAALDDDQT
jgi:hypothetical protein